LDEFFTEAVNVWEAPVFIGTEIPETLTVTCGGGVELPPPPQALRKAVPMRMAILHLRIIGIFRVRAETCLTSPLIKKEVHSWQTP
jgi:hypothetical protein